MIEINLINQSLKFCKLISMFNDVVSPIQRGASFYVIGGLTFYSLNFIAHNLFTKYLVVFQLLMIMLASYQSMKLPNKILLCFFIYLFKSTKENTKEHTDE